MSTTNLKTYWDLSEKERLALEEPDIQRFIDIELMQQGLVRPLPPVLRDEPEVTVNTTTYFMVNELLFNDIADAEKVLNLNPMKKEWCYEFGTRDYMASRVNMEVVRVELPSKDELCSKQTQLQEAKAIKEANERASKEYDTAIKAIGEASSSIRENLSELWDKQRRIESIMSTYGWFLELADGDEETALRFLCEKHSRSSVIEAFEWTKSYDPFNLPQDVVK